MVEFATTGMKGWGVSDNNIKLRFFIIFFAGIVVLGAILFWKSQLLFVSEYQEFPKTQYQIKTRKQNILKQIELQNQMLENLKKEYN